MVKIQVHNIKAEIARKSADVLLQIRNNPRLSHYVPTDYIPDVYIETDGIENVRLVVIGQDPTVKRESSRKTIKTALNLDKPNGSLYKYLYKICDGLRLDLRQHIYATNFAKNFFIQPPTQIEECNVLDEFDHYWLPLLREELSLFPDRPVLALGEPLLESLLIDRSRAQVRRYWGYTTGWESGLVNNFSFVTPEENKLRRRLFPFPHQPSMRKRFYRATLRSYLSYMKENMTQD